MMVGDGMVRYETLDVPCPVCTANRGEVCRNLMTDRRMSSDHPERVRRAQAWTDRAAMERKVANLVKE